MRRIFTISIIAVLITSCTSKKKVDLIVTNAKIYTVDATFSMAQAFAVKDGKFIEVGSNTTIIDTYQSNKTIDAKGKAIYPGLIDAHTHFYQLGIQQQKVDLTGTQSFEEVVSRIIEFQQKNNQQFITGWGWDQNDWKVKEFPRKDTLDRLFPDTPIAITRIDGHAVLANQAALNKAGITTETTIEGGEIQQMNGKLTGILIDNPVQLMTDAKPELSENDKAEALKAAQKICFSYGLTSVADAGLDRPVIELIDSLQKQEQLKIRIYAMISNTKENLDYYLTRKPYKTDRLYVNSVKFYGDGALGSRGAALKEEYSDRHGHFGALLSPIKTFKKVAARVANSSYQLNTHAIGDSANYVVLKTYDSLLKNKPNRRWRVEHAQIIDKEDFKYFSKNIIPSVQPTHATSDMYWAEDRLGPKRLKNAYAYKKLLDQAGVIALGTDFPIEKVSPFLTFHAAVARKDTHNFPKNGFMKEEALSREETLKGMTIWAAYASFEEDEKGSIEPGKFADFIMVDKDIMEVKEEEIPTIQVLKTVVNGEEVYSK